MFLKAVQRMMGEFLKSPKLLSRKIIRSLNPNFPLPKTSCLKQIEDHDAFVHSRRRSSVCLKLPLSRCPAAVKMQGFNMGRYHAPESLDASLASSLDPAVQKKHPLGSRAKNIQHGVLVVRFEMPFAIWCSTCPACSSSAIIGQGVRFNAQKKHVGKYFSSPIWSFRMKHTACGGWIELRTDPKNSDFIVTEGAKRRDYGAPEVGPSTVFTEAQKKRQDAFSALEDKRDEKVQLKEEAFRLEELRSLRERDW